MNRAARISEQTKTGQGGFTVLQLHSLKP
jgi:hypothetical protein